MATPSSKKEVKLEFVLPPELEEGIYASIAQVRGTPYDYVITFLQPIIPLAQGPSPDTLEARAVARVVVPKGLIGPLIDALQTARENVVAVDADEPPGE